MSSPKLFNYYVQNVFKFPNEIKNDIIYCQRTLKNYIKVHQRLFDYFQNADGLDLVTKKSILDQVETEIYEINAEQHFLFLRLRRVIFEFNRILKQNNIEGDKNTINLLITKAVVPIINNKHIVITPITVAEREEEDALYERFIAMTKKEKQIFEVLDSEDEVPVNSDSTTKVQDAKIRTYSRKLPSTAKTSPQVSLLKPMSQRNVINIKTESPLPDATQFLQIDMTEDKSIVQKDTASKESKTTTQTLAPSKETIELPVSKNVKMSRLNLRQVLKNVRSSTLGKTLPSCPATAPTAEPTGERVLSSPPSPPSQPQLQGPQQSQSKSQQQPPALEPSSSGVSKQQRSPASPQNGAKKGESKSKTKVTVSVAVKAGELTSSSDDSNQDLMLPPEEEDDRTMPENYEKETFLRLFHLYTPDIITQMQQRRSKRKRRCVHSNERADFHYGRLDSVKAQNGEEQKKKRKAFLLSPQVKQGLQAKRPKRCSADKKEDDVIELRSSSSSPDETGINQKRMCHECLKSDSGLDECNQCKKFFHQKCPLEEDNAAKESTEDVVDDTPVDCKSCHSCRREFTAKQEHLKFEALELELRMKHEKARREILQTESKSYKIEMKNLYDIVKAIRSDEECSPNKENICGEDPLA